MGENIGQSLFFTGKIAFISKICVYNNPLGPKKRSYDIHSICKNTF